MASKLRREYSRSLVLHAKLYPKNILAEAKIGHICYRVPPNKPRCGPHRNPHPLASPLRSLRY